MSRTVREIREVQTGEYQRLGQLMVEVYSGLEGFPKPEEQPAYYEKLANIGYLNERPHTRVLVALSSEGELLGGVVYFSDMISYGSGGAATTVRDASGIRLLGVDPRYRGLGVGKSLTQACLDLARKHGHSQVVLHTTAAMRVAWGMYERLGFERSPDLDFLQEGLQVFGFRLPLKPDDGGA
ncbi:MAG: GNAT family N-acetyltransferase [Gammaproteobacteria bacterium]|jgi:ribosomal protein S18 acetylase RimI-like enzyme